MFLFLKSEAFNSKIASWLHKAEIIEFEDQNEEEDIADEIMYSIQTDAPGGTMDDLVRSLGDPLLVAKTLSATPEGKPAVLIPSAAIRRLTQGKITLHKLSNIFTRRGVTVRRAGQKRHRGRVFRIWYFEPSLWGESWTDLHSEELDSLDKTETVSKELMASIDPAEAKENIMASIKSQPEYKTTGIRLEQIISAGGGLGKTEEQVVELMVEMENEGDIWRHPGSELWKLTEWGD